MEGIGLEYDNIDNTCLKSWNIRSSNANMCQFIVNNISVIVC